MLPRRLYIQCPICDVSLEAAVQDVTLGMCTDEEDAPGLGLQVSAFVHHECED